METQELNLFIVDDNKQMVYALKHFLNSKFGEKIRISTFFDGESALKNLNDETDVVILDYFLNGENGNDILKFIKERNPKTEVIMLSGDENVETAIQSFKLGAINYVVKSNNAWRKIAKLVRSVLEQPIRLMTEFKVTKFVSIFIFTFLLMGALISLILKLIP